MQLWFFWRSASDSTQCMASLRRWIGRCRLIELTFIGSYFSGRSFEAVLISVCMEKQILFLVPKEWCVLWEKFKALRNFDWHYLRLNDIDLYCTSLTHLFYIFFNSTCLIIFYLLVYIVWTYLRLLSFSYDSVSAREWEWI